MGQYYAMPYAYRTAYPQAYQQQTYTVPAQPQFYNQVQMLPQDQAAVDELGPEGVATGVKALNIASNLAKNVFPENGNIINPAGEIQTKWGKYQLSNMQDADVVEKLLDATRDLLKKIPRVE